MSKRRLTELNIDCLLLKRIAVTLDSVNELKQEEEHINKIKIQSQGTENCLLFSCFSRITCIIHLLNRLRVISRQGCEQQHTNHRNRKMHRRTGHENIDYGSENNAD